MGKSGNHLRILSEQIEIRGGLRVSLSVLSFMIWPNYVGLGTCSRINRLRWRDIEDETSSPSKLYLWVKSFQFNSGIGCGKLPIDTLL